MSTIDVNTKQKNLCWLLVKNRLMAQLGFNVLRYDKDGRNRNKKIALTVISIFLLIMVVGYSAAIAYGLAYLGLTELIPGIALLISSMITLIFTIFKANGELFGFKDYDVVMSLPVPVRTVINSRFLNMYIWNTSLTLLIMLPMGIVYAYFMNPPLEFYIMWIVGTFLACLLPTTIAAVFGAVITAISSKFRYASAASTILSIVFLVAIMMFTMTATTADTGFGKMFDTVTGDINMEVFSSMAPAISDSLNQVYPPARLFTKAIVSGSIGSFLFFAGISVGWYALFVFLLSVKFKQINTALTSHRSRADYKLGVLHQGSMLFALYKKTTMRILKSTICATNMLVGCIIAILVSVSMLIAGPEKVILNLNLNVSDYMYIVKNAACYVIGALICMCATASVSLALEGKNIWLIKSLPIPTKILYDSYLLTNLTFTVPTSIVCSVLFSISLKTDFIQTLLMILTPLIFSVFSAVAGVFIGNRMAYYDWQEETQLVKQSMMSMIAMLGGMMFVIICGVIANIGIIPIAPNMITIILDILLLILTVVIYYNESNRPVKE